MDKQLQKNIIKKLGLDKLSAKEQEDALLSIGRIIFQAVLIRVIEELDDAQKDEFEKIIADEPADEKKVMEFLQSNVPDLDKITGEEIANLKKETLNLTKI